MLGKQETTSYSCTEMTSIFNQTLGWKCLIEPGMRMSAGKREGCQSRGFADPSARAGHGGRVALSLPRHLWLLFLALSVRAAPGFN